MEPGGKGGEQVSLFHGENQHSVGREGKSRETIENARYLCCAEADVGPDAVVPRDTQQTAGDEAAPLEGGEEVLVSQAPKGLDTTGDGLVPSLIALSTLR